MKIEEVMPAFRQGKIVKRTDADIRLTQYTFFDLGSFMDTDWTIVEEPKPPKLLAHAMCANMSGTEYLSASIFESEGEAKRHCVSAFKYWPAIPNKDGFYEVPQE